MEFALLLKRVCTSLHTCGKCYYSLKRREKSLQHLKPSASIMGSIRLDLQASGIRRTLTPSGSHLTPLTSLTPSVSLSLEGSIGETHFTFYNTVPTTGRSFIKEAP